MTDSSFLLRSKPEKGDRQRSHCYPGKTVDPSRVKKDIEKVDGWQNPPPTNSMKASWDTIQSSRLSDWVGSDLALVVDSNEKGKRTTIAEK